MIVENQEFDKEGKLKNQEEIDEDLEWKKSEIDNFANQLLEEAQLKKKVIEMENLIIQKKQTLQDNRVKHIKYFDDYRNASGEDQPTIEVNQYQQYCIEKIEERIKYLQDRAEKIKNELEYSRVNSNMVLDPSKLNFAEQLQELLHQNKSLEKYIRSENFRINREIILTLKHNLSKFKEQHSVFKRIRKDLERSYNLKFKLYEKKKKEYEQIIDNQQLIF